MFVSFRECIGIINSSPPTAIVIFYFYFLFFFVVVVVVVAATRGVTGLAGACGGNIFSS